jgi:hypothetical protein
LGEFLGQFPSGLRSDSPGIEELNPVHFDTFLDLIDTEHIYNPWFTPEFVRRALEGISFMLEREVMDQWLVAYPEQQPDTFSAKTIGLVLAGNIPLVGFHDILCVLLSGHKLLARPSTKDDRLIRKVAQVLIDIDPGLHDSIRFTDDMLSGMDAVIATGSDNSARYFEYYFRNIPHIIRKNRNAVAVLTGKETEEELTGLGNDIFAYFGLGCRNVTKIYIPVDYDLKILMGAMDRFNIYIQHHKYGNNVDYYRTIYLMNQVPLLDNGVLLLKEDVSIASPPGVVFYERYSEIEWVQQQLKIRDEEIQCKVSIHPDIKDAILPGETQKPLPWDYADGVDTIRFLMDLNTT